MIIAVTGHREKDCPHGENTVRDRLRAAFIDAQPTTVIVGMANGVDLWSGAEALNLGINVVAARPWATHTPSKNDVELYARVINGASRVVNVDDAESYVGPWLYHKRNEWMVDHATHVLAYWSGKLSGGTYACLRYAIKQEKPIRNIYAQD